MGFDMTDFNLVKIFLNQTLLDRLIEYVVCITDPLLYLIRRAEELLLRSSLEDVPCVIYADELRRLADIQEQIGNRCGFDRDIEFILEILSK